MKIGEFGNTFNSTIKKRYLSTDIILDLDALIIDLDLIISSIYQNDDFEIGYTRTKDLNEFLSYKNVPIIYFAPIPLLDVLNNIEYAGPATYDYDQIFPIPKLGIYSVIGETLEIQKNTLFTEFMIKYEALFYYESAFAKDENIQIANTPHGTKVLGLYNFDCVILPKIDGTKMDSISLEKTFLTDLMEVVKKVRNSNINLILPEWTENYYLPNEMVIKKEIENIEIEIENLKQSKILKEGELSHIRLKKKLLSSTGKDLEIEVANIFSELGFEIIESKESNKEDLIVRINEKYAVIEIKGLTKSAGEKNNAQLEKWCTNFIEVYSEIPKGILIVNSYIDLPLSQRIDETFPHQMLKYSVQREHCLLTTIQLLNIYYTAIRYESKKDEMVKSLFTTNGVYSEVKDWREYITYVD